MFFYFISPDRMIVAQETIEPPPNWYKNCTTIYLEEHLQLGELISEETLATGIEQYALLNANKVTFATTIASIAGMNAAVMTLPEVRSLVTAIASLLGLLDENGNVLSADKIQKGFPK